MSISEAMEQTIAEGISRGILDVKMHAGPIECVRALARRADIASDNDPNTFPTLLKYLAGLNLVDAAKPGRPAKMPEQPAKSKLEQARERRFHAVS